jgi:hypothetical protein
MIRNPMQPLRTLAATALAVVAIACADRAGPTALASINAGDKKADSTKCDLTLKGTIRRYAGAGDSASDTLGRRVPLKGARIELYYAGPLPVDSVPRDSVPRDSVPRDSVPRDSVPRDSSHNDSLHLRGLAVRGAAAADSSQAPLQPAAKATSGNDGTYTLKHVCPGIYRVQIYEPGTGRSLFTFIIVRGDMTGLDWTFPPAR